MKRPQELPPSHNDAAVSPQRVDQVELRQLVQVEDSRGEARHQQVGRLVIGRSCQVIKVALLVEEMSGRDEDRARICEIDSENRSRCFREKKGGKNNLK